MEYAVGGGGGGGEGLHVGLEGCYVSSGKTF